MRYFIGIVILGTLLVISQAQSSYQGVTLSGISNYEIPQGNLFFWVDSDHGVTVDSSAGSNTVSRWDDRRNNGLFVTNGLKGTQPGYQANKINGHAQISFSRSQSTRLDATAGTIGQIFSGNATPFAMFLVVNQLTNGTMNACSVGNSIDPITGAMILVRPCLLAQTLSTSFSDDVGGTQNYTKSSVVSNQFNVLGINFMGTNCMSFNGLNAQIGILYTNGFSTLNTFTLGNRYSGANAFLGKICEILVYSTNQSPSMCTNIINSLKYKYGGI